jgi:hypothetical protein
MQYNSRSPLNATGNRRCDHAQSDVFERSPSAKSKTETEPRRCAMANKDQKSRSGTNKPKLSIKEKKERKERKAAAKQRDR